MNATSQQAARHSLCANAKRASERVSDGHFAFNDLQFVAVQDQGSCAVISVVDVRHTCCCCLSSVDCSRALWEARTLARCLRLRSLRRRRRRDKGQTGRRAAATHGA